ncbi:unnamed protein product, partial [Sphacelaria rigidula]
TRPVIANAVQAMVRYSYNPEKVVIRRKILDYVRGSPDFGLIFPNDGGEGVVVYADADYVSQSTICRSCSGAVIFPNGSTVDSHFRRWKGIEFSTTEAEYLAMVD